jgi:flagellar basal-body rod modification protein FlgD
MSDIISAIPNPTQALDNNALASAKPASERAKQEALGQADFFKLLTTQLASQDPLEPMDDTAFIAQMASFSELEMTSQMNDNLERFTNLQQFQASQGYIGKKVTVIADGEEITGIAEAVEREDEDTRVFVDGRGYNANTVFKVEQP